MTKQKLVIMKIIFHINIHFFNYFIAHFNVKYFFISFKTFKFERFIEKFDYFLINKNYSIYWMSIYYNKLIEKQYDERGF
jgi:hypothetical protein